MNKIKMINLLDKGVYIGCRIYLIGLIIFLYYQIYNLIALNVGSQLSSWEMKQYIQDTTMIVSLLETIIISMVALVCGVLLRSAFRYYATVCVAVPTIASLCFICVNYI